MLGSWYLNKYIFCMYHRVSTYKFNSLLILFILNFNSLSFLPIEISWPYMSLNDVWIPIFINVSFNHIIHSIKVNSILFMDISIYTRTKYVSIKWINRKNEFCKKNYKPLFKEQIQSIKFVFDQILNIKCNMIFNLLSTLFA